MEGLNDDIDKSEVERCMAVSYSAVDRSSESLSGSILIDTTDVDESASTAAILELKENMPFRLDHSQAALLLYSFAVERVLRIGGSMTTDGLLSVTGAVVEGTLSVNANEMHR